MAKYHKITGNESIGTIAEMYGTNPQTLLASNPGMSTLAAGAYLRVPSLGLGTNTSAGGIKQPLATPAAYNPVKEALKVERGTYGQTVGQTFQSTVTPSNNPRALTAERGTYGQTLQQETFASYSPKGQTNSYQGYDPKQQGNLNAQQVAELNLANARNTFKPSSNLLNWNQQVSSGVATPLTPSMFNELTTISVNNGLPRDAAILAVNSMLQAQGYTYNPITKGYVATDKAPAVKKDISGNPVSTDGGKFSADSWENYKQKTIARGEKRWWIGKGKTHGENTAAITPVDGSNAVTGSGQADSIWRIG